MRAPALRLAALAACALVCVGVGACATTSGDTNGAQVAGPVSPPFVPVLPGEGVTPTLPAPGDIEDPSELGPSPQRGACEGVVCGDDPVEGDCKRCACDDVGRVFEVVDSDDVPSDDGIACYIEACFDGLPTRYPDDALCDDGDPDTLDACLPRSGGCVSSPGPTLCEPIAESDYLLGFEDCGNGLDDNGDGRVNEGCDCERGMLRSCWSADPANRFVGALSDGVQRCGADERWGACTFERGATAERINGVDDDGDGCVVAEEEQPLGFRCANAVRARHGVWVDAAPGSAPTRTDAEPSGPTSRRTFVETQGATENTLWRIDAQGKSRLFSVAPTLDIVEAVVGSDLGPPTACYTQVQLGGPGVSVATAPHLADAVELVVRANIGEDASRDKPLPDWGHDTPSPAWCMSEFCHSPRWRETDLPDGLPYPDASALRVQVVDIDAPREGDVYTVELHSKQEDGEAPQVTVTCDGTPLFAWGGKEDPHVLRAGDALAIVSVRVDAGGRCTVLR